MCNIYSIIFLLIFIDYCCIQPLSNLLLSLIRFFGVINFTLSSTTATVLGTIDPVSPNPFEIIRPLIRSHSWLYFVVSFPGRYKVSESIVSCSLRGS